MSDLHLYLGNDHEGLQLKQAVKQHLERQKYVVHDVGTNNTSHVDYPDYAALVSTAVSQDAEARRGILICGTGIGMCMVANRYTGIRAGAVWTVEMAARSREDDNVNMLCLAGAFLDHNTALEIVDTWLKTPFSGEERHVRRLHKVASLDKA